MALVNLRASVAVVCGSGLRMDELLDSITGRLPFSSVPGLSQVTVPGHGNEFLCGKCGDVEVLLQTGRLHLYEGLGWESATLPLTVLGEAGVGLVIFTSAVGGLRENMARGDLVAIRDVSLWPSRHLPQAVWDRPAIQTDLLVPGCDHAGRYHWMSGPCYETRAEIEALRRMESDVVGMSLGVELLRCRELGMKCAAVSCVTNNCLAKEAVTHQGVVDTAALASERISALLRDFIRSISRDCGGNL